MGREKCCGAKDKLSGAKCTKDASHTDPNAHRDNSDPGCVITWVDSTYKPGPTQLVVLLPTLESLLSEGATHSCTRQMCAMQGLLRPRRDGLEEAVSPALCSEACFNE